MEKCKVSFDALPWQSPLPDAKYKVFQRGNRRLRFVEFSHGFVEPEWCINGHVGYVLDGDMDVDFDGETVHFSAGDGIFIPAGAEHRHRAKILTDVVRLVLVEEV